MMGVWGCSSCTSVPPVLHCTVARVGWTHRVTGPGPHGERRQRRWPPPGCGPESSADASHTAVSVSPLTTASLRVDPRGEGVNRWEVST